MFELFCIANLLKVGRKKHFMDFDSFYNQNRVQYFHNKY